MTPSTSAQRMFSEQQHNASTMHYIVQSGAE